MRSQEHDNFSTACICCCSLVRLIMLSGTGALAIFLRKSFWVDITTSDYDDKEIEENIAYNCRANNLDVLPHIRREFLTIPNKSSALAVFLYPKYALSVHGGCTK